MIILMLVTIIYREAFKHPIFVTIKFVIAKWR